MNGEIKNISYLYDQGGIIGFVLNDTVYRYIKNLQGGVIAIYRDATKVAEYAYDAWGNCKVKQDTDGIGTFNAIRYRGYYFDVETGLYYLMSRYYDPSTGRFLSPDDISYLDPETIHGLNLFAYCGNNPVMNVDPEGHSWWDAFAKVAAAVAIVAVVAVAAALTTGTAVGVIAAGAAIGGAIGGVTSGVVGAVDAAKNGEDVFEGFANSMLSGTISGTISGAVAASPIGKAGQTIINGAISGLEYSINSAINNNFDLLEFGTSVVFGGGAGYIGGNGLLKTGVNGLKTAGNSLVKNLLVKDLTIKNLATFEKYLAPMLKSTCVAVAGGIFKIFI